MSNKGLADLFSSTDDALDADTISQDGIQLFDHVATRAVTYERKSEYARFSTGMAEDGEFDMIKGDNAHIFKVDEQTMLVRIE